MLFTVLSYWALACTGIQRYKLTKVVKEQPVLIAEVELLPEDDDTGEQVCLKYGSLFGTCTCLLQYSFCCFAGYSASSRHKRP